MVAERIVIIEDWSHYNDAVTRAANRGRRVRAMTIAAAISLIVLALALAYYVYRQAQAPIAATSVSPLLTPPTPPPAAAAGALSRLPALPEVDASGSRVVTNFTIFRSVDYLDGTVVSGWEYANSRDSAPSNEFCYFHRRAAEQDDRVSWLAFTSRAILPVPSGTWTDATWRQAASRCQWFGNATTGPVSAAPLPPKARTGATPTGPAGIPGPLPAAPRAAARAEGQPLPALSPSAQMPDATEPVVDPAVAASVMQGLTDRTSWERSIAALPPGEQAGADWWAAERSAPSPRDCGMASAGAAAGTSPGAPLGDAFLLGCTKARSMMTPFDQRRLSDPAYRRGWNSYSGDASRAGAGPSR